MTYLGRSAVAVVFAAAALFAAGCGETVIDSTKMEGTIEENLQKSVGQKVSSVDCPSGVEVKAGTTFDCTVNLAGGKQETATLKILNSDADTEITNIKSGGDK